MIVSLRFDEFGTILMKPSLWLNKLEEKESGSWNLKNLVGNWRLKSIGLYSQHQRELKSQILQNSEPKILRVLF